MNFAAMSGGLLAALLFLPGSADAFTCEEAIWAVQHFTTAELEAMAAPFGGISKTDRAKARRCLREAGAKGIRIQIKAATIRPSP